MVGKKILLFKFSIGECCLIIQDEENEDEENEEESSFEEDEWYLALTKENLFSHPTPFLLDKIDTDIQGVCEDILSCSDSDLKRLPTLEELSKALEEAEFSKLQSDELKAQSDDLSRSQEEISALNRRLADCGNKAKAINGQIEKEKMTSEKLVGQIKKLSESLEESKREKV